MKTSICAGFLGVLTLTGLTVPQALRAQGTQGTIYAFTELGSLAGEDTYAYGINNQGQIVGESDVPGTPVESHAFLYSSGVMTDLGTLGGGFGGSNSSALAINDESQVVGYTTVSNTQTAHAFLYDAGVMTDLGELGSNGSKAYGINNLGQVVGDSDISDITAPVRAFLYSGGMMTNLGAPAGKGSAAFGINDSSQIVGNYTTNFDFPDTNNFGTNAAFLDSNGSITDLSEVGGLGNLRASAASAINNQGQVTGYALNSSGSQRHAYLYSGGSMTDLGTLDSTHTNTTGNAINNLGQVVGIATTNEFNGTITNSGHAFIYSGGTMTDLNNVVTPKPGWTLQTATGINDYGQIVGYGVNAARVERAFLLTPMPVLAIAQTGNSVVVSWPTNGLNFELVQSSNVISTNWTTVTNMPMAMNGTNQVTITPVGGNQFYRLMLVQ